MVSRSAAPHGTARVHVHGVACAWVHVPGRYCMFERAPGPFSKQRLDCTSPAASQQDEHLGYTERDDWGAEASCVNHGALFEIGETRAVSALPQRCTAAGWAGLRWTPPKLYRCLRGSGAGQLFPCAVSTSRAVVTGGGRGDFTTCLLA
eukprot:365884-Chlamydomonas_euryale.AAC.6